MVKRILKARAMHLISLLTGLILACFIIVLLIMHTDFFAHNMGRTLSRYLFSGTPFSLRIESLGGNPLKELEIRGLNIRYQGEDFSFDVIRVNKIDLSYDLLSLASDKPVIRKLILVEPHLWIKPDTSGINIIPGTGVRSIRKFPRFAVDSFAVIDGQVIYQGRERADAARNINVRGSLLSDENGISTGIMEGSGESISRNLDIRRLSGTVRWIERAPGFGRSGSAGGRLFLEELFLELEKSALTLDGIIHPDSMSYSLKVKAEPIDVQEIARAIGIETSHTGELQGDLIVKGITDSLGVTGTVNGVFSGFAMSDFNIDLDVGSSRLLMKHLRGDLNGAHVEGSGSYAYRNPEALHVDIYGRGLNLAAGFVPGRDMPHSDFDGKVNITYFVSSGDVNFRLDLDEGHIYDFPFIQADISGSYQADSVSFDRIWLKHPTHEVLSHGYIKSREDMRFYIDLDVARSDTLFPYFGIEEYRADVELNGIWEGGFDSWRLHSSGMAQSFSYRGAIIPVGHIKLAVLKNEDYSVYFDMSGDSLIAGEAGFSGVDLSLEYIGGITRLKRLHVAREGIDAEIMGDIEGDGDATVINISELSLEALDERWMSSGKFRLVVDDSLLRFEDIQLHSREGALYFGLEMNQVSRRLKGRLNAERLGTVLLNRAGLIDLPVEGKVRGSIMCDGPYENPDVVLDLRIEEATIDTIEVDTLIVDARYSGGCFTFDSLNVISPAGVMKIKGNVCGTTLEDIYRNGFKAFKEADVDLGVTGIALSLAPMLSLSEHVPFTDGKFTGEADISGSLAHPLITLKGAIADLESPRLRIPSIDIYAVIGNGAISVEGTFGLTDDKNGRFNGRFPLDNEEWLYSFSRSRPINLELELPREDLENVPALTQLLAEGDGSFSVAFNIGGTLEEPNILGQVTLDNVSFRLSGMEERFYDVKAKILIENRIIRIAELTGSEGRKGRFRIDGTIGLEGWRPGEYNLTMELEDVLIASIPDIMAIASGRMNVGTRFRDGQAIPDLTGDLEIKQMEVFYDIGDLRSAGTGGTLTPPAFYAEIDLDVPGNSWVKTPDASIELQGEITLHHDERGTYLRGKMELIRGYYMVYNNKFRVVSGELNFVHAGGFRPVVDIEAETQDPENRRIYLTFAWHQDDVEPRLSLRHEDPGYSETDIWKMLGGGAYTSSDGQDMSWDPLTTAQSLAANYIERMLNSQMGGLTIELEAGDSRSSTGDKLNYNETMIAIGRYMSQGLYVKYKQGLSMISPMQVEVEYRLSRRFLVRSKYRRYSGQLLSGSSNQASDEVSVDLQLRWEY